jgi:hypothetical protein
MNLTHRQVSRLVRAACLLFGALLLGPEITAQPVIQYSPSAAVVPRALRPAPSIIATPGPGTPFAYGPVAVFPRIFNRFVYVDGLHAQAGRPLNSYQNTLSPGVRVDIGDNWTVDYGAGWTTYTNKAFRESLSHQLSVAGNYVLQSWAARFNQLYSTSSDSLVETARQTDRETAQTSFSLRKSFHSRLYGESSVGQSLNFLSNAPNSYSWTTQHALTYRVIPDVTVSASVGGGYIDMDPGVNMAYLRMQGQLTWAATDKISVSAGAGENIQQIYSPGVSALYTPVFDFTGRYRPFEQTELFASANRQVSPSVLRNQVTDTTTWRVGARQRLLGRFQVEGSYGEQEAGYRAANLRVLDEAGRKDIAYFYQARISTGFWRRGSIAGIYQVTDNSSNRSGFGIASTQVGVEVGYRY